MVLAISWNTNVMHSDSCHCIYTTNCNIYEQQSADLSLILQLMSPATAVQVKLAVPLTTIPTGRLWRKNNICERELFYLHN